MTEPGRVCVAPPLPAAAEGAQEGFEAGASPEEIKVSHTLIDFTPAEYITLLFTDLGVLTPAAVSDELIRLYQ